MGVCVLKLWFMVNYKQSNSLSRLSLPQMKYIGIFCISLHPRLSDDHEFMCSFPKRRRLEKGQVSDEMKGESGKKVISGSAGTIDSERKRQRVLKV